MANKFEKWWDSKPALFKKGLMWAAIFLVVYRLLDAYSNNMGLSNLQMVKVMDYLEKGVLGLGAISLIAVVIGLFSAGYKPRHSKEDEAVEVAKGVWMVKK